ncbi:MAG: hypothetical protein ABI042_15675 [Verrucomicrobiota bacterium]
MAESVAQRKSDGERDSRPKGIKIMPVPEKEETKTLSPKFEVCPGWPPKPLLGDPNKNIQL